MSEATRAAERAEFDALNARCAASPREAALLAAKLRRTPHADKLIGLVNSAINNHAALARLLLADGLSPNTVEADQSLLHIAAFYGSFDVLRLLLESGANANSLDGAGNTPLQGALCCGHLACARELIPHTDLRILSADGMNVLHKSIIANQFEIFKLLLPHFSDDIDVRTIKPRPPCDPDDRYNRTPLMCACAGGYHAMVKALLGGTHKAECQRIQAANEEKARSLVTIIKSTKATPAP